MFLRRIIQYKSLQNSLRSLANVNRNVLSTITYPTITLKRSFAYSMALNTNTYCDRYWNNDLNAARRDFYANPGSDRLRWRSMAFLERQNRNYDNARHLYEEYLRMDPSCLVVYNDWAYLESQCRNFDQARDLYEHILEVDPSNNFAIKGLMYVYRQTGEDDKLKTVVSRGENIVDNNNNNNGYTLEIAKTLYKEGKVDKAREAFSYICKNETSWKYIFLEWSSIEYGCGNKDAAVKVLYNGLQFLQLHNQPIPSRMYHMLGLYLQEMNRIDEAELCYYLGTKTLSSPYLCWKEWAKLELLAGKWEKCNTIYLKALSDIHGEPGLWMSYISIIEKAKHNEMLPLVLEQATKDCPDNFRLLQRYIMLQFSSGNTEKGMNLLQSYITKYPKDSYGYLYLASEYRKKNDITSALDLYKRALDLQIDPQKVYQEMGYLYMMRKEYNLAKSYYKKSLQLKQDITSLKELGEIEYIQGHYEEALPYLQAALDTNNYQRSRELAFVYGTKAKVLLKLKRVSEAESAYLEGLKMNKTNIPLLLNYCDDILIKQRRFMDAVHLLNKGMEVDKVGTFKSEMNERLLYALKQTRKNNK
ncbi:hypothetical protein WA158_002432 [Blastocystis sp. Blastoise]